METASGAPGKCFSFETEETDKVSFGPDEGTYCVLVSLFGFIMSFASTDASEVHQEVLPGKILADRPPWDTGPGQMGFISWQ